VPKNRLEAFADGIFAIAATLLTLNLAVSEGHPLGQELLTIWPQYAAYAISFVTIGIIWINHHAMLQRLVSVDHAILVLNLLLLLTIGVLPFSTALMAEYLNASHGQNLAAVVYGGSFLLMSLAFFAIQRHLLLAKPHLLQDHLTPEVRQAVLRRNATGLLPYAVATVSGIVSPFLTLAICALVGVFYALPRTRFDVQHQRDA